MIPQLGVIKIVEPQLFQEHVLKRDHNRILKAILRDVLREHWKKRIPEHFRTGARNKYKYARRSSSYKRQKLRRYGSRTDLVKTGRTRASVTGAAQFRMGGGGKRKIRATVKWRLPFSGGTGRFRNPGSSQASTIQNIRREITATTEREQAEMADEVERRYVEAVEQHLATRKRRRRMRAR